jgi:hypothetical protein
MARREQIYHSTADIGGAQITTIPTAVREIAGENVTVADFYIQVYSRPTTPTDGTDASYMLIAPMHVPAGKRFDFKFDYETYKYGLPANSGLYICASSTKYIKTIVVAAMDLTVIYES